MLSCAFCAIYEPIEVNTYMLLVLLCAIYSEQTNKKNANHTLDSVQTREGLLYELHGAKSARFK